MYMQKRVEGHEFWRCKQQVIKYEASTSKVQISQVNKYIGTRLDLNNYQCCLHTIVETVDRTRELDAEMIYKECHECPQFTNVKKLSI